MKRNKDNNQLQQRKVLLIDDDESLRIRGRVDGVVFAAGENVELAGEFSSSLFSAGENVSFRGAALAGNLFAAGEKVVVHDDVTISGNNIYRIFNLTNSTASINNLTMINGKADDGTIVEDAQGRGVFTAPTVTNGTKGA